MRTARRNGSPILIRPHLNRRLHVGNLSFAQRAVAVTTPAPERAIISQCHGAKATRRDRPPGGIGSHLDWTVRGVLADDQGVLGNKKPVAKLAGIIEAPNPQGAIAGESG